MTTGNSPWVLGIGASHNGAVCLLRGAEVHVAIQEERLAGQKRTHVRGAVPSQAVAYCLDYAGIGPEDLSMVAICTRSSAADAQNDLYLNRQLRIGRNGTPVLYTSHHLGHAASSFAVSGFEDAAVLVVDGIGSPYEDLSQDEAASLRDSDRAGWESISIYRASADGLSSVHKQMTSEGMLFPNDGGSWSRRMDDWHGMPRFRTLGGMYGAVARQIFGDPLDGAGKAMGLAPLGTATIAPDEFATFADGYLQFSDAVPAAYRHDDRWPMHQDGYADLARSSQEALESFMTGLAGHARAVTGAQRLCLAGGVALNGIANERIIREVGFEDVFIIPAAEDSGTALGAAYLGLWELGRRGEKAAAGPVPRPSVQLKSDGLGRRYLQDQIQSAVDSVPNISEVAGGASASAVAERLARGQIVGWFSGGAELGPRALGHRSILCDPRDDAMKKVLNSRVKRREGFRPFAPAILVEHAREWFELDGVAAESPHMLRVCRFRDTHADRVPAVAHRDGTGRLQTVDRDTSPELYRVIDEFRRLTGVPMLLNTSFNIAGEPIVENPEDALWCMLGSGIDCIVIEGRLFDRTDPSWDLVDCKLSLAPVEFMWRSKLPDFADALDRAAGHPDRRQVRVPQRWGQSTVACDRHTWDIITSLALKPATGRELSATLGDTSAQDDQSAAMRSQIMRLRRMGLISIGA